jgi:hypothetical protein
MVKGKHVDIKGEAERREKGSRVTYGHASKNGTRDGDKSSGKFGKDAHDDEEEATRVTGLAVGAAGQRNDTIVLRKSGHRGQRAQRRQQTVDTIGEDAALDARLIDRALDLHTGEIACGGNVADGLGRADDVDGEDRQDQRSIDAQREGVHPDEGGDRGGVDAGGAEVACCGGDNASDQEADDD